MLRTALVDIITGHPETRYCADILGDITEVNTESDLDPRLQGNFHSTPNLSSKHHEVLEMAHWRSTLARN